MKKIILFDGNCNFCDKSVQFIIQRDPAATFTFASLSSDIGKKLIDKHYIPKNVDSIVLIDGNEVYIKSDAALQIAKDLKGFWKLSYFLKVIPKSIRDFFYDKFAKRRYQWFGKKQHCAIPSPEMRKRFL